jgi:hypothetical protein
MRTDVLDIVHLHSCPLHVLEQGDVIRALEDCQRAGKLRVCAYSGDNAELRWAMDSGRFDSVQASVSFCDQANLVQHLPTAKEHGVGVIAKRPLAGAVWRFVQRPGDFAEGQYWDRFQAMGLDPQGLDWGELAALCGLCSRRVQCDCGDPQAREFFTKRTGRGTGPLAFRCAGLPSTGLCSVSTPVG